MGELGIDLGQAEEDGLVGAEAPSLVGSQFCVVGTYPPLEVLAESVLGEED